jgi:predicted nucleotidyltransferase
MSGAASVEAEAECRPVTAGESSMSQDRGTERILSKIVAWGAARDDLRGIAVVGSRARADHPADPWSDLDLIVMARRPRQYLAGSRWLAEIETPWLAVREPTPIGGQHIFLVTFEGGTKVDLVVASSRAFSLPGGGRPCSSTDASSRSGPLRT